MYELIDIIEDDATRFVRLKDMDTGTVDECFDDSVLVSDRNFDFMRVGGQYDCKIKLFGKPVSVKANNSVICKLLNREVVIGQKVMVEVQVNDSRYYIPRQKVRGYLGRDSFDFCFTRKDLIQVNDTIHADLL